MWAGGAERGRNCYEQRLITLARRGALSDLFAYISRVYTIARLGNALWHIGHGHGSNGSDFTTFGL